MGTLRRILLAEGFQNATIPIVAVALALATCWLVIALTTPEAARIGKWERANEAYRKLAEGGLGVKFDPKTGERLPLAPLRKNRALGETALKTALLVFTGLSVAIALRAGLFNIGAEGQFIVGAITAAYFGWRLDPAAWYPLPAAVHPVVVMLLAMTAAGLYGALAGALKVWRGVHEVIGTIMLNWIAYYLVTQWLVTGPLNVKTLMGESGAPSVIEAGTPQVRPSALLWTLFESPNRMNAGILIALGMAFLTWIFLYRTRLGYEVRAIGSGPEAARAAGIPVGRRTVLAMFLAGALAGLAGATYILGTEKRYAGAAAGGYGFDGIAICLLGANHPLGVLPAALFFGAVRAGVTHLQLATVPIHKSFADLIQGCAILFVTARYLFRWAMIGVARRIGTEEAQDRA